MRRRPPKGFEKPLEANRNTTRLAAQLNRSLQPEAHQLGLELEACLADDSPSCGSGACPRCCREVRLQLLHEAGRFVRSSTEKHMLTLIWKEFEVTPGRLHTLDMRVIKKKNERFLRRYLPKNLIVIGGIDVSLTSFENDNFKWSVHIHVIILKIGSGPSIEDYKEVLREKLPDDDIKRPLKVVEINPIRKRSAVTYCLKSSFEWRSGYLKTKNLQSRAPHRATRGLKLKPDAEVELRLWLSQWTMANRLILVGVANPASPKSIKLRDTSRTPKQSEKDTCPAPGRSSVTRSRLAKKRSPRRRIKGGAG